LSTVATFSGPSGSYSIGSGSGNAEEGITIARVGEKNTMTLGADGTPMHSLHGANGAKMSIRLLKTSPVNALLNGSYNTDRQGAATWGLNTLVLTNLVSGDVVTCDQCAFTKHPDLVYATEGGFNDWEFDVGICDENLG